MNAQTTLILLVALLVVTSGGVMVFNAVVQDLQGIPSAAANDQQFTEDIALVNVIGTNISADDTYKHMRIQVRYDGDDPLNLNDTFIQVRTTTSTADLWYRNGTTQRDVSNGFYTE